MDAETAYYLINKDPSVKNILIYPITSKLGDFIYWVLLFGLSIKLYKPYAKVYIIDSLQNKGVTNIIEKFKKHFVIIEDYNLICNQSYDMICAPERSYKLENFLKKLNYQVNFRYKYTNYQKNIYLWHSGIYNKEFVNYIHPNTLVEIKYLFKIYFYSNDNKFNIKKQDIVINIGSISDSNTNYLYQDRISTIISNLPYKKFFLVGFKKELESASLIKCLNHANVISLLDKEESILDLINILYHCGTFIVKNTGTMHLAGLCDTSLITFPPFNTVSIRRYLTNMINMRPDIIKNTNLFFKEAWSPISNNTTSIVEYKWFNICYNNRVPFKIIDLINEID